MPSLAKSLSDAALAGLAAVALPPLANIAAVSALTNSVEGVTVRVQSVRDFFVSSNRSSPATVDGITVATHSGGGNWRWERLCLPHVSWGLQSDWGIDPTSGSDDSAGTLALPLKTAAEFMRRTKGVPFRQFTKLEFLGNASLADSVRLEIIIGDRNTSIGDAFYVKGFRTTLAAGAITTFTVLNRSSTPATPNTITASVDFTTHVGKRLRMTSGAAAGYSAWILTGTNGSCTVSSFCQEPGEPPGSAHAASPTQSSSVSAGNTFEIVDLCSLGQCSFAVAGLFTSAANQASSWTHTVVVRDIKCTFTGSGGLGNLVPCEASAANASRIYFDGCDLGGMKFSSGSLVPSNCRFWGGTLMTASGMGGLGPDINGGCALGGTVLSVMATAAIDGDFIFQGVQLDVGGVTASRAMFPTGVRIGLAGFFGLATDAILVRPNAFVQVRNGNYGAHQVWGVTSAGRGIRLYSLGKLSYLSTKPTINASLGSGREVVVGGTDRIWSSGVPYVEATNLAAIVQEL